MWHLLANFQHFYNWIHIVGSGDGPNFDKLTQEIIIWLNAFITPVSIIIGGLSLYKLMALGWKIAHTADRPDERKIAILSLVWWGLGLVLCIAAPLIINLILPALLKAGSGPYNPSYSYIF